jgi:tetratricopeptide (TPR) repeat protein
MLYSCSAQNNTITGRGLQNLTARYNYLYNARLIIKDQQQDAGDSYITNYQQILPVYVAADLHSKNTTALDKVIHKANTIIREKSYSRYTADAYLLLAEAYFLKGNYFLAKEYFDEVAKKHTKDQAIHIKGLDGSLRCLVQRNEPDLAAPLMDSLIAQLKFLKKDRAAPLVTLAQSSIAIKDHKAAITYLEAALNENARPQEKSRWTCILAQLYEAERKYPKALYYFRKVEKSNDHHLRFYASLNRIKLNVLLDGNKAKQQKELRALLKDDRNAAFHDQLYNRLAELEEENAAFTAAAKYHQLALQANTTNQSQKSLSYTYLADLHFKHFKNYQQAMFYYDSAATHLPANHPDNEMIKRKTKTMAYLAKQYAIISPQNKSTFVSNNAAEIPEGEKLLGLPPNPDATYLPEANINAGLPVDSMDRILKAYLEIAAIYQLELKDHEEAAKIIYLIRDKYPENKIRSGENLQGELAFRKKFNTITENYRKKNYFTYVQQQPSPETSLQYALPETPLKPLPLSAAENEGSMGAAVRKPAVRDSIFTIAPSNSYYFVIAVNNASINLSSSRFGIGQFNRRSFAEQGLKHRLTEFDNDQLIYIGNFSNFENVKIYTDGITPQLQQVMKVPAKSYYSFIISKDNFEKINNKDLLNKYLEFYKNNF